MQNIFLFKDFTNYLFALITVPEKKNRAAYQHFAILLYGKIRKLMTIRELMSERENSDDKHS